jgi:gliding motility-associated-like protein
VVGSYDYCYDTAYYPLYIWPDYNILIPSAFSPNDDQLNDEFHIRGNFHSIKYATWMVYNENGIEVFRSNDILDSWNGNLYNGTDKLPMGNYQVVLVVTDNNNSRKTFNSKVSLIR